MVRLESAAVFSVLVCLLGPTGASPRPRRDLVLCESQEYRSGGVCCQNCPEGTFVASPCTVAGRRGTCRECDDGTFMEHATGLRQCFRCTKCRPDQVVVAACSHTRDTECRCGPDLFCDPEQACELCQRCSRCERDEEAVRNCTPTSNTECKKVRPTSAPPTVAAYAIVLLTLAAFAVLATAGFFIWKCQRGTASQTPPEEQKSEPSRTLRGEGAGPSVGHARQLVRSLSSEREEEELQALCESLSSSASNSQHSLTGPPGPPSPAGPPGAPSWEEEEEIPRLVAVNGEESLRRCFEYFEELDINYHKKFFRRLGINDNVVKDKDDLPYQDRLHELLNIWIEKAGKGASLHDLLQVLRDLKQCRTADNIKEHAVRHGHYRYEENRELAS